MAGMAITVKYDQGYWLKYLEARTGRASNAEDILADAVKQAGSQLDKDLAASVAQYYTIDALDAKKQIRSARDTTTLRYTSSQGVNISHFNVSAVGQYRGSIPAYLNAQVIRGSGGGMLRGDGGKAFRAYSGRAILARSTSARTPVDTLYGPSSVAMLNRRFEDDKMLDPQQLLSEHIQAAVDKLLEG